MTEQNNRIAIVTGTSSGIGKATARELLRRGWQVVGISRRTTPLDHPNYRHLSMDLSMVESLSERVTSDLDPIIASSDAEHIALVNSAASPGLLGTIERTDAVAMLKVYALNVVAPAFLMGWLARMDSNNATRTVVNISSGVTESAYPGMSTYGGTKVALKMTGAVLAAELDAAEVAGMVVHSYDPGPVDTPMQTAARNASPELLPIVEMFEQFAEQGMLSEAGDHARAIADFLESEHTEIYSEQRFSGAPEA
jgi:3-oxoacyl-[acyl-carrier protein] reductase